MTTDDDVVSKAFVEQKRIIKILKKWISYVDCPNEKEIYFDMITWVEQKKSSVYYKEHAATMQANINTLHDNAMYPELASDEKAVFNFISGLIEAHGS